MIGFHEFIMESVENGDGEELEDIVNRLNDELNVFVDDLDNEKITWLEGLQIVGRMVNKGRLYTSIMNVIGIENTLRQYGVIQEKDVY